MKEVKAYQDDSGRLHKNKSDAIEADFVAMIQKAWAAMPSQRADLGNGTVIAQVLASDTYRSARSQVRDAIDWLEEQRARLA